jgi:hypothetical protein
MLVPPFHQLGLLHCERHAERTKGYPVRVSCCRSPGLGDDGARRIGNVIKERRAFSFVNRSRWDSPRAERNCSFLMMPPNPPLGSRE